MTAFELIKSNLQTWRERESALRDEAAQLVREQEQLNEALAESKRSFEEARAALRRREQSESELPRATLERIEARWRGEPMIMNLLQSVAGMEAKQRSKQHKVVLGLEEALMESRTRAKEAQRRIVELQECVDAKVQEISHLKEALATPEYEQDKRDVVQGGHKGSQRPLLELKDQGTSADQHMLMTGRVCRRWSDLLTGYIVLVLGFWLYERHGCMCLL